jgi:hypothetical protein
MVHFSLIWWCDGPYCRTYGPKSKHGPQYRTYGPKSKHETVMFCTVDKSKFKEPSYVGSPTWIEPMRSVTTKLLNQTVNATESIATRAICAFQLLPGLVAYCNRLKRKGEQPLGCYVLSIMQQTRYPKWFGSQRRIPGLPHYLAHVAAQWLFPLSASTGYSKPLVLGEAGKRISLWWQLTP